MIAMIAMISMILQIPSSDNLFSPTDAIAGHVHLLDVYGITANTVGAVCDRHTSYQKSLDFNLMIFYNMEEMVPGTKFSGAALITPSCTQTATRSPSGV